MLELESLKTSCGKEILLDAEDIEQFRGYCWKLDPYGYVHNTSVFKKGKRTTLHRVIMNPPVEMFVDHKNGDKLDNRKSNLRICTKSENNRNRKKYFIKKSETSSQFKGVRKRLLKSGEARWTAVINPFGKNIRLGTFKTEIEAANAYDLAAFKHFGEFAKFNRAEQSQSENSNE